jgi:hypothetical protein
MAPEVPVAQALAVHQQPGAFARVVYGHVKVTAFRISSFAAAAWPIASAAEQVQPDRVVIARLDTNAQAALDAQVARIRIGLQKIGYAVEPIVPDAKFGGCAGIHN